MKAINLLGPLLYKYRYRKSLDPYQEVSRFREIKTASVATEEQKKVLIVPYRVSSDSNLFEGNCSLILKSRGFNVDALMCGQALSHCEQVDSFHSKPLRCSLCNFEQRKFLASFGLNGVFVDQYVSASQLQEIERALASIDFENLQELSFSGVKIFRPLNSALQLHFKRASFNQDDDRKEILGFLRTIFKTICCLDSYFAKNNIEFVLLSHGVYSTWGTVQEYCQARSIRFVTWGREYHGAGVIAAHNSSYLSEPMYEQQSVWDKEKLTPKQIDQITNYLNAKTGKITQSLDFVNYNQTNGPREGLDIIESLGLDNSKKIVGLFPNIPWDGQAFRPNKIFNDVNDWLYETIEWFSQREDATLVIRTHPAERFMKSGQSGGLAQVLEAKYGNCLPENIKLVPASSSIKSISIAEISQCALLYGSTIGYETMFLRIPTIVASDFFYSNKGISFDPTNRAEYFNLVESALAGDLFMDEDRYGRLLQFAYHYQFRRIMPETIMRLKGLVFDGYKSNSIDKLLADPALNKFIDCCISGNKFYFDEFYE